MNMITCKKCGEKIEISAALQGQIEAQVLAAEHEKHKAELERVKAEAEALAKLERESAAANAKKQLESELELIKQRADADLELAKKKLELEVETAQRKAGAEQEMLIKSLRDDAESAKEDSKKFREQISELMTQLREANKARENADLEAQKRVAIEAEKIREEIQKTADEKQRYDLAAKNKTIEDLQKALDAAQRKAAQGSQQLQGEIMELDFEETLASAFRDDEIEPIAKGVKGGDIRQVVKSPRGKECGVILWEIKRTKNWTEGWVPKLKEDLRNSKSNVAVIITEAMPKDIKEDIAPYQGIWVCKPALAVVLGALLRKGMLEVGYQKALAENRGGKAESLYNFVTSHEFIQQIESMVETYQEMSTQVTKERVAYEKLWAQREKQAQKLLLGTANIVGSMQGHIGQGSMPKIKGLELGSGLDDL